MNSLPSIHALWIGDKLGMMAYSCLSSFVNQGHQVHLHVYDDIDDLPQGVILMDASKIIPRDKIIKHKSTGSYALFSDIFRYELLKRVDGIYVDCDVYCLKPLTIPEHGYLLGYEDDNKINGAVLALPKDSELLNKLIDISHDPSFIPPWYAKKTQKRLKRKKFFGLAKHISDMPWGVIGPEAITHYAKHFKVDQFAKSIDIFYPVYYDCIGHLLNPKLTIQDVITHQSLCIHLYNEKLRRVDFQNIHENCILFKILNT